MVVCFININSVMLNKDINVQECDARMMSRIKIAGNLKKIIQSSMIIQWQAPLLKLYPVKVFWRYPVFFHSNTIIYRAYELA